MQTLALPFIALLYFSPLLYLIGGSAGLGFLLIGLSLALFATSQTIPPGEAQFFQKIIWPAGVVAALPGIFMMMQILPLPGLAHPVWQSAARALGQPFPGCISVDIGATLLAFCRYGVFCAAMLVSAAIGVNRVRAETILTAALAAATIVALLDIVADRALPVADVGVGFAELSETATRDVMPLVACLGFILALAFVNRLYEKREVHRFKTEKDGERLILKSGFGLAAALICGLVVLLRWNEPLAIALAVSLLTFAYVFIARRLELGHWGQGALVTTALVVGLVLLAKSGGGSRFDLSLRFAPVVGVEFEAVQRMLSDAPILGTGAGTFASLAQLYGSAADRAQDFGVPVTARIAVEMGRGFLWVLVAVAVAAVVVLVRSALRRGRDWVYSAAAASCLMAAFVLAFASAALQGSVLFLLLGTIVGVGLAQSRSRALG